ncbi:MAG: hypothetical protein R2716_04345 [Microthrixaceae bacterium]
MFTIIDSLKVQARRAGEDIIDLGFGNPDLPSPELTVEKLTEAATTPQPPVLGVTGHPEAARGHRQGTTQALRG